MYQKALPDAYYVSIHKENYNLPIIKELSVVCFDPLKTSIHVADSIDWVLIVDWLTYEQNIGFK